MRKILLATACTFLLIGSALPTAEAAIKIGSKCANNGEVAKVNSVKYTCKRVNGKVIWQSFNPGNSSVAQNKTAFIPTASREYKDPPVTIPGSNIDWPKPLGELNKYSGISENQRASALFGLRELHSSGVTGSGYSVAFIDSTIIKSHSDFDNSEVICINRTSNSGPLGEVPCPISYEGFSHGQGVSGTIGGKFGVAPGARIISIQGSMVSGLEWVINNYKKYNIVSVSLSIGESGRDRNTLVCGVSVPEGFKEVLENLANQDVAVLFSTANQGTINWVREPNCMPGVISVASVQARNPSQIAIYSSISPDIDLLAPADFFSSGSKNDEVRFGGTSQATPFAAAIFALGKQARPDANIAQIFYYMKQTAAPVDDVFVKKIPVVRPVEMVDALKKAAKLPDIKLIKQIQNKSGA